MARRKRGYLDEGYSSDSASSSDSVGNKKGKGKEDAIYGIFGDEGENEQRGGIGRTVRGEDRKGRKIDYLRGQAFVSATNSNVEQKEENDDNMELSTSESDQSEDDSSSSEMERFARQAAEEEEEVELRNAFKSVPTMEGQEAEKNNGFEPSSFVSSRGGIGSQTRGGIGSSRLGTGAKDAASTPNNATILQQNELPSLAFSQRASQTNNTDAFTGPTPKISFKTGGGKFDPAKYLAQMGWSGGGLGKQGEGIVKPIEVKQRPERVGIAFGGIKEKTKQAKEEARRRGEQVSSDEEHKENKSAKNRKSSSKVEAQAWTKSERKPRKPKIEHRTYEQILAEHGHNGVSNGENQIIVDATGKEYSSLSAALAAKQAVPTNDSTQLIEIRHNLRLICDGNLKALDLLANEGAAIQDRRKWLERELNEAVRRKQDMISKHNRVETIAKIVGEIELLGKRAAIDPSIGLDSFIQPVQDVLQRHRDAIAEMEIDAALVGAIIPIFKRELSQWSLLQDPTRLCTPLKSISGALRISAKEETMTPYQSLLWNVWMPPVRSALNNDWNVFESTEVTKFYESWLPLLPAFIRDNVTHQIILPKLRSAVSDWDGKSALYKIVFPWMPLLHHQMDDIISEAKRRIRSSLRSWKVSKGVPSELRKWRDVFRRSEWESMLLEHIVEKLSTYLKVELKITSNPRAQDRQPLKDVLQWKPLMGSRMISKILLSGFIPNWLEQMHAMLTNPNSNTLDVADWYSKWKTYLEKKQIDKMESIQIGFQAALQMMDDALRFDRLSLKMPDLKQLQRKYEANSSLDKAKPITTRQDVSVASFRQIVEEAAAEADLIVQPLNKTETKSGMPLYRISRSIDGKAGLTFYLEDDVIFLERKSERGQFDAISIEELIKSCV